MQIKTNIAKVVEEVETKARYDEAVKKVLSDPQILAWILKYTVKEFQDFTIPGIISCMVGAPEVAIRPVHPEYYTKPIEGLPTEEMELDAPKVTYDIRFRVKLPGAGLAGLIVNVEAQNKFYESYDLITRGVFYCARMLSTQIRNEESAEEYNNLQKVYSIWICMQAPRNSEYTITGYRMNREDIYGHMASKVNHRYDLMELLMICLGRPENAENGTQLHRLLSTVLSEKSTPKEKLKIMKEEYGIVTNVELEGGLAKMCNLSDYIVEVATERGMQKGMQKGIQKGIQQGMLVRLEEQIQKKLVKNKSLEQIAEELETDIEEIRPIYFRLLEAQV